LTGAGWGGCVVALVAKDAVESVINSVRETFYKSRIESGVVDADELSSVLFATMPSTGAAILKNSSFA